MTDEPQTPAPAGIRPSKLAITKMLAEVEARRSRAVRYSLFGLLLPLAVGAALLVYIVVTVGRKLEENRRLDGEIAAKLEEIESLKQQKATLESGKASLAGTVKAVEATVSEAARNGESAKEVAEKVQQAIAANPNVAEAAPFVFIQIHDEAQRKQEATRATEALRRAGFDVRGVERVASANLAATEVRYFRPEDKPLAERAAAALKDAKLPNAGPGLTKDPTAKPGQIELWFAPVPGQTSGAGGNQVKTRWGVVVLREFKAREDAFGFAMELRQKKLNYPVEVFQRVDGGFYVTLGGLITSPAEGKTLLYYAQRNVPGEPSISEDVFGENLLP